MSRSCPRCGREMVNETNSESQATSVEIFGAYDGGLFYAHMPGCGFAWHRWPEDHPLRERAQPHIDEWNKGLRDG